MIKGLKFLSRTNSMRLWNLASYHSPHSLTWRWVISFSLFRGDEGRVWPIWMGDRNNNGYQLCIRVPFIGILRFSQQRPMWYRDLYIRLRDERDRSAYERSKMRALVPEGIPELSDCHHSPETMH